MKENLYIPDVAEYDFLAVTATSLVPLSFKQDFRGLFTFKEMDNFASRHV